MYKPYTRLTSTSNVLMKEIFQERWSKRHILNCQFILKLCKQNKRTSFHILFCRKSSYYIRSPKSSVSFLFKKGRILLLYVLERNLSGRNCGYDLCYYTITWIVLSYLPTHQKNVVKSRFHKILQWREIPFIYVSIVAFGLRDSIIVKIIIVCKLFDNICTSSSLSNLHPPCSFFHDLKLKRWTLIDYEFFMVRVRQCLNRRDIRLMYWRLKTSHLLQGTFTWF